MIESALPKEKYETQRQLDEDANHDLVLKNHRTIQEVWH